MECHAFLFSIPFSWVIYIFPNLRIATIKDHICDHIRPCESGHFDHLTIMAIMARLEMATDMVVISYDKLNLS